MKKLFLGLAFLVLANTAYAADYYLRPAGGTKTQCTGLSDVDYDAGAHGTACAWKSPHSPFGAGCGNGGGQSCDQAKVVVSGDTVHVLTDNGTAQAQYPVGYDAAGIDTPSNGNNCKTANPYNCTMAAIPSGVTIVGHGTHQYFQFYGREKLNQVMTINGGVTLQNFEFTDHSPCLYRVGSGTVDGLPLQCPESGAPLGNWAIDGLWLSGDGNVLTTGWIHGFSHYGVNGGNLSNATLTNVIISGNGFNNDAAGGLKVGNNSQVQNADGSNTATFSNLTYDHYRNVFGGCGEHYPMVDNNIYNKANYHNCHDAGASGQGDGVGSQADFTVCSGYIKFIDSDVSYNSQDGIDYLHCGAGNFYFIRSRAEGNAGNQVKTNNRTVDVENSLIINNCQFMQGQSIRASFENSGSFETCRGGGDGLLIVSRPNEGPYNVKNTTILSTGGSGILIKNDGGTCATGSAHNFVNNLFIGGNSYYGGQTSFYDTQCNSPVPAMNYNAIWNSGNQSQCTGANSKCGLNPQVTGSLTNVLGPNFAHTVGTSSLLYLTSGSPLVGAGNPSLSFTNGSTDFNTNTRSTPWDIGAYKLGSLVPSGAYCSTTAECNGQTCTGNICGGTITSGGGTGTVCTNNGGICAANADCCTNFCSSGSCAAAPLANGQSCTTNNQCSSGNCCTNACSATACVVQICPNGIIEGTEGCDDNNSVQGDGCSSLCQVENANELPLTYESNDPNGNLNILTNSIDFAGIDRNFSPYVRKDFGAGFFGATTDDTLTVRVDSAHDNSPAQGNGAIISVWAKSVNPQTGITSIQNTKDGIFLSYYYLNGTNNNGPTFHWSLSSMSTGVEVDSTLDDNFVPNSRTIEIAKALGGGYTASVYADAAKTSLIGTMTLTDNTNYRYFMPLSAQNTGASGTSISGNVGPYVLTVGTVSCGDHTCNGAETCNTCPGDCGACPVTPTTTTKFTITGPLTCTGSITIQ